MKKLATIVVLMIVLAVTMSAQSTITVFRESGDYNYVSQGIWSHGDKVPGRYSWTVYIDGVEFGKLHPGQFITVKLEPGNHEVRTSNGAERVSFQLAPNEH